MRDETEKVATLPASSASCSPSSMTPISEEQHKEEAQATPLSHDLAMQDEASEKMKNPQEHLALPRRDFLAGIRKLIKSFKSLSHVFELYKEDDEDMDMNIEIGFPTDVQHVAHIGLDGSNNIASLKSLEGAKELLSLSSLSLEQFELAMASLARHEHNVMESVTPN